MDPCLLADPFVASGWVKRELGAVESQKTTISGLLISVWVPAGQREKALRVKLIGARNVNCFALKKTVPFKGVITWVAVNVKVDQLKGKIPGVCDARCLVRRIQGGVSGETEESLLYLFYFILMLSL